MDGWWVRFLERIYKLNENSSLALLPLHSLFIFPGKGSREKVEADF